MNGGGGEQAHDRDWTPVRHDEKVGIARGRCISATEDAS